VATMDEPFESGDSSRTSNEELNAAGIARYVWLAFLSEAYLSWVCANRTRKHPTRV
jgi:hypothetical protein